MPPKKKRSFLHEHSLSVVACAILILWLVLYAGSDPGTRWGAFFGNAAADWTGVVIMVVATKFLYERGSRESKPVRETGGGRLARILEEHSLSIFLILSGLAWLTLYARLDPGSRWGQVVGNVLSEWL